MADDDTTTVAFSGENDREQLKQAILECTRAEVLRALNEILGGRNPANIDESRQAASVTTHSPPAPPRLHRQRPQTVEAAAPGRLQANYTGQRPNTSKLSDARPSSQSLPLESSVDCRAGHTPIDRSSFHLLKRSSAIIQEATGEAPKKYDGTFRIEGNHDPDEELLATATNNATDGTLADTDEDDAPERVSKANENDEPSESDTIDELKRVESWPVPFRPTTATRLIHTSHSVLKDKPPKRRPLTTTALARRKPPPSTAASEREKAKEVSRRLLGPITLEPRRPNYDFSVPQKLAVNEWENELARNIISVFSNKARSEIKGEPSPEDGLPEITGGEDSARDLPPTVERNSLFSDESAFRKRANVQDEDRDFERISISRGALCFNADTEFSVDASVDGSEQKHMPPPKKPGKGRHENGTFRLKMIWHTGTGLVRANWEAMNEVDSDSMNCEELSMLEEKGQYRRYVGMVESSILRWNAKVQHAGEHSGLKQQLWRQLIVTCNCFATRLIERRKYAKAMEMLEKATSLIDSELGLLPENVCDELTAMIKDTYAYYYIRRSKPSASYQYLISAINLYKRRDDALHVAKCRVHQSFIQCAQHKYSDSMKSLRKILAMVENGALDIESDDNHVLLLASVAYHNIAVQQLMLGYVSDACVSSQNARRLSRLCLSVSSNYLPMLESTHKQALHQLSAVLKNSHCESQAVLFHNLISELFD